MLMRLTQPDPVVDLQTAKAVLRVNHYRDDAIIQQMVNAATDYLDGSAGILRRCLCTQTWRLITDQFECEEIELPLGPAQSITAVKYLDQDDAEQTFPASEYYLYTMGMISRVRLKPTAVWPVTSFRKDAVRVDFVSGYGASESVPAMLKQAILVLTSHMYEFRELQVNERTWPTGFDLNAMVEPYRLAS